MDIRVGDKFTFTDVGTVVTIKKIDDAQVAYRECGNGKCGMKLTDLDTLNELIETGKLVKR